MNNDDANVESAPTAPDIAALEGKLADAINSACAENGSDTPDFILAAFLSDVLRAFDKAILARSEWYGHNQRIDEGGTTITEHTETIATLARLLSQMERERDSWHRTSLAISEERAQLQQRIRDLEAERDARGKVQGVVIDDAMVERMRKALDDAHYHEGENSRLLRVARADLTSATLVPLASPDTTLAAAVDRYAQRALGVAITSDVLHKFEVAYNENATDTYDALMLAFEGSQIVPLASAEPERWMKDEGVRQSMLTYRNDKEGYTIPVYRGLTPTQEVSRGE